MGWSDGRPLVQLKTEKSLFVMVTALRVKGLPIKVPLSSVWSPTTCVYAVDKCMLGQTLSITLNLVKLIRPRPGGIRL